MDIDTSTQIASQAFAGGTQDGGDAPPAAGSSDGGRSRRSERARVVVTDHNFPSLETEERILGRRDVELAVHQCKTDSEVQQAIRGAHVALVQFAPVTRAALASMAHGAAVVRYGVGVDNIDLEAASELGVSVANVPDYCVDEVADHASTMLLSMLRKVPQLTHAMRRGVWQPTEVGPVLPVGAATIGFVGFGRIARAVHQRLASFGSTFLAFDPYASPGELHEGVRRVDSIDALVSSADAISLHVPLTPETRHLMNADRFAQMKSSAILVNTSRGSLIDEHALIAALESGTLGGAALDVFETEPLAETSALWNMPNVLLTPHAAWYSSTSISNLQRLASEEASRALAGQPIRNPVTSGS